MRSNEALQSAVRSDEFIELLAVTLFWDSSAQCRGDTDKVRELWNRQEREQRLPWILKARTIAEGLVRQSNHDGRQPRSG